MTIRTGRVLRPIVELYAEDMIREAEILQDKAYNKLLKKGKVDLVPVPGKPVITDHLRFFDTPGDGRIRYARAQHRGPKRYGRWSEM